MRVAIAIVSVPLLLFGLYLAMRGYVSIQHGYAWAEMDWNGDGSTTVFEFSEASDIGSRPVTIEGRACQEYFADKDTRRIRLDCR